MDEEGKVYSNLDTRTNWLSKQKFVILFSVLFFVLGSIATALVVGNAKESNNASQVVSKTNPIPTIGNTDPRQLLDPIEILKSGVFTEWGASIEGTVVKKSVDSFTVEKNGRQVEIFLQKSFTGFYAELPGTRSFPKKITFEDLKVGDSVKGGVTIQRGSLDNDRTHHIFANIFTVTTQNVQNK